MRTGGKKSLVGRSNRRKFFCSLFLEAFVCYLMKELESKNKKEKEEERNEDGVLGEAVMEIEFRICFCFFHLHTS